MSQCLLIHGRTISSRLQEPPGLLGNSRRNSRVRRRMPHLLIITESLDNEKCERLKRSVSPDRGAMQQGFDAAACTAFVDEFWPARVMPALKDFVRIPNLSKFCDPAHLTNGHMQRAAKILVDWSLNAGVKGLTGGLVELPGKDPVLFLEIAPTREDADVGTVLMYGHLDKQPPVDGWDEGLAPYDPVERDGYLLAPQK